MSTYETGQAYLEGKLSQSPYSNLLNMPDSLIALYEDFKIMRPASVGLVDTSRALRFLCGSEVLSGVGNIREWVRKQLRNGIDDLYMLTDINRGGSACKDLYRMRIAVEEIHAALIGTSQQQIVAKDGENHQSDLENYLRRKTSPANSQPRKVSTKDMWQR